MKKLAVLLLTTTLALGLAACGSGNGEGTGGQTGDSQESSVSDISTESVPGPEPLPETESLPETDQQPGDEGSQTPEDGISEEMSAIRQAVSDALGDNYWPDTQIPPEFLEGYGLTGEMYTDFFGEMPMISTNVDTLIVIRAGEGQADAVEGVLNSYRDTMVNDTMQYPSNVGVVQASQVKAIGDYVCFVQLGADTMPFMDEGDEAVIRHCQELNEAALEAIEGAIPQQ